MSYKRWTIKDLAKTSDLKFAACILNERRTPLNPYTPMAQKLEHSKNMLLRMDAYLNGWGSGTSQPTSKTLEILYRDGYHSAARLIECMAADHDRYERESALLGECFAYLAEALPRQELRRVLIKNIGLTEEEIRKYQMEWLLEDQKDGETEV